MVCTGAVAEEICDGIFFWRVWVLGRESKEGIFASASKKFVSPAYLSFTASVESSVMMEV